MSKSGASVRTGNRTSGNLKLSFLKLPKSYINIISIGVSYANYTCKIQGHTQVLVISSVSCSIDTCIKINMQAVGQRK